jgi:hypothetical protein
MKNNRYFFFLSYFFGFRPVNAVGQDGFAVQNRAISALWGANKLPNTYESTVKYA